MSLQSIFLTALIFLGVSYWFKARDLKQLALSKAKNHCKDLDLALLDESVVLKKISPIRNRQGNLVLSRAYQFDFTSNGEDRYQGMITLAGRQVLQIQIPPHRID
jgi:hypothetical protein